jgi:hypothetical protein
MAESTTQPVSTESSQPALPVLDGMSVTSLPSLAPSVNASVGRPVLVAGTQLAQVAVTPVGNRMAVQVGGNPALRPVRLLAPTSAVRLTTSSNNMQVANVPMAVGSQGNLSVITGAAGNAAKTQFVLCQVSGGKTVLMPQSAVSGIRLATAANLSAQQPMVANTVITAAGQAGNSAVQASSGLIQTQVQIVRTPISVQNNKSSAVRPASGIGTQLQVIRATPTTTATSGIAGIAVSSQIQIVQLAQPVVAEAGVANRTAVASISGQTSGNAIRLLTQPTRLRLLSPAGSTTAAPGIVLKQAPGQRFTVAVSQGANTIPGNVVGAGGLRLISIRGGTPLSVIGSGGQVVVSNPTVSQVRLLAPVSSAGVVSLATASVGGKLQIPVASSVSLQVTAAQSASSDTVCDAKESETSDTGKVETVTKAGTEQMIVRPTQSVVVVQQGTPLVLQSGAQAVRAGTPAGQLVSAKDCFDFCIS